MRILLFALCLIPSAVLAQSNATNAALEGYIFDPSGTPVANAQVRLTGVETGQSAEASSNDSGYYRFPLLRIGSYSLHAQASGFGDFDQRGIALSVGSQARVDIHLQLASTKVDVTVNADVSPVDVGAVSGSGGVLGEMAVRNLPIVSRNIYNNFLLNPGVKGVPSNTFGTPAIIFSGNYRATYLTDGVDNTQRLAGSPTRLVISTPEAVEEVQVLSSNFSAEFGKSAGGIVNIISKSGTNDWHWAGMFLGRPNGLTARAPLAAAKTDAQWRQFSGTISGPVVKNRIFFFANHEYSPLRAPAPATISPAVVQALNLPNTELEQTGTSDLNTSSGKLDFQISERHRGFIRYARFSNNQIGMLGGLNTRSRGNEYIDRMYSVAGQLISVVTPNFFNEFRINVSERNPTTGPIDNVPLDSYTVDLSGQASIGINGASYQFQIEKHTQFVDNITVTHGHHTLKSGLDFERITGDWRLPLTQNYTFGGLPAAAGLRAAMTPLEQYQATLAGQIDPATQRPYTYTLLVQNLGEARAVLPFNQINMFAQDEFRISPSLTLNFGARYQYFPYPTLDPNAPYPLSRTIRREGNNIAPRVGFAWSPWTNSRTVIRGGYGLFYDLISTSLVQHALLNGNRLNTYTVSGGLPGAPRFGTLLTPNTALAAAAPSITAYSNGFRSLYAQQGMLQVEHAITSNLVFKAGYNASLQRHLPYQYDINLGSPVGALADGRPIHGGAAGRPNKQFAAINLIDSGGNNNYHGLDLALSKRMSNGLSFTTTYSWSHAIGDVVFNTGSLSDPSSRARDRGNSSSDIRHSLNFHSLYTPDLKTPFLKWVNGFMFASAIFYNSGLPVNGIAGTDLNRDTVLNDRPLYQSRNGFPGPSFFQIDARLSRRIRLAERHVLELIAESENLTNRLNAACHVFGCTDAVVNVASLPDFGRVTVARPGRAIQLGIRYTH